MAESNPRQHRTNSSKLFGSDVFDWVAAEEEKNQKSGVNTIIYLEQSGGGTRHEATRLQVSYFDKIVLSAHSHWACSLLCFVSHELFPQSPSIWIMNSDEKKDYANDGQLLRTYTAELQLYLFI